MTSRTALYGLAAACFFAAASVRAQDGLPIDADDEVLLTLGDALKAGLAGNPELRDAGDFFRIAAVTESGVASTFKPQATPFYSSTPGLPGQPRVRSGGLLVSQQFPFGTHVDGQVVLTHTSSSDTLSGYEADYLLSVSQPLLKAADPAVSREPLRLAHRSTERQFSALDVARRRAVLSIVGAYLAVAEQDAAVGVAEDRLDYARKLLRLSEARYAAGSVSRLDVLRAQQELSQARVALNSAVSALEDARDALRRTAGLQRDYSFCVEFPSDLPSEEIELEAAETEALERRPEVLEARRQVTDAEFAVRIAKSERLPTLDAVADLASTGLGATARIALRAPSPHFSFGVHSEFGLNLGLLAAQLTTARIGLESAERNYRLFEEDIVRDVRRTYRHLNEAERNQQIANENVQVAGLQQRVAQVRYEKGLSDNFNVVDAENLLTSARLFELASRALVIQANLDYLYATGALNPFDYVRLP